MRNWSANLVCQVNKAHISHSNYATKSRSRLSSANVGMYTPDGNIRLDDVPTLTLFGRELQLLPLFIKKVMYFRSMQFLV